MIDNPYAPFPPLVKAMLSPTDYILHYMANIMRPVMDVGDKFFYDKAYKSTVASVEPFAFAGIYSHWKDADTDEEIRTYSILTTAANKLMSKIHNTKMRMPVILHPELERKRLDQTLLKGEINDLILPYDDELMEAHTITKVFSRKNALTDVPDIQQCVEYPELALLG
jgi:putative SOS response-associated peptidase YedK